MLEIISRISTINIQTSFTHCSIFFGFETEVRVPVDSQSMYNSEDAKFEYSSAPNFSTNIIYANYMDMTRLESTHLMDNYEIDPVGYTLNDDVLEKSRLTVPYQGKTFEFTVLHVNTLELDDTTNGVAIKKLILEPFN